MHIFLEVRYILKGHIVLIESSLHLYHFRCSTIKSEIEYVKRCWELCLEDADMLIPVRRIVVEYQLEIIWLYVIIWSPPPLLFCDRLIHQIVHNRIASNMLIFRKSQPPQNTLVWWQEQCLEILSRNIV